MTDFEWIVLAVGLVILNFGWFVAYYLNHMQDKK